MPEVHLHKGDCFDLFPMLEPGGVAMTVTSPPYDGIRKYDGQNIPVIDYHRLAAELYKVHKPGGVVVWIVSDQTIKGSESMSSFKQALAFVDAGWRLHDTMIWAKDTASMPDKTRYAQTFEYMFVFSKG